MSVIPAVLLNALREYSFVGYPLWRMSEGKDLVRVKLTFHKNLAMPRFYKKGAVSRRQPAPSAGEWPRQPAAATTPMTRSMPARRQPTMEKEMPPPPTQTLQDTPRQYITHGRTQKTATIQPSPIITRPPPAISTSPVSPPKKKSRTQSPPAPANKKKNHTRYDSFDFSYPIHEKYDLQEVYNISMMNTDTVIVKAQRLQCPDETINIDLPVFFMYKLNANDKKWVMVKGPTSKFYFKNIYEHIQKKLEKSTQQKNIISWYNYLEQACMDPGGQI